VIRRATEADVPAIARVHVDVSRATYAQIFPPEHLARQTYETREAAWRGLLADPALITLVALDGNEVVGFANGGTRREGPPDFTGELWAIYLRTEQHRRGIGRDLVGAFASELAGRGHKSMLVWVLRDNPACAFYRRLDAVEVATQSLTRGDRTLEEVAFGWRDEPFARLHSSSSRASMR
jgi:ribosomal protein S18 acetylase RimI-like enzyme